jgi:outer membrane protein OmpA-like peptidoglycan-associated protein
MSKRVIASAWSGLVLVALAIAGCSTQSALNGNGAGAARAGSYLDRQERALRTALAGTPATVTRTTEGIVLIIPTAALFEGSSADLRPNGGAVLTSAALIFGQFDQTRIAVTGHTDNTGTVEYLQALSENRANTVAQYLKAHGVAEQRVTAFGAGATKPLAGNDTLPGRQSNRRIEITVAPAIPAPLSR